MHFLDGAELTDVAILDQLVEATVTILSDLGNFAEADSHLDRFEASIPGKTARFIRLCNLRCYSLWCRGDHALAVEWGSRGDELKTFAGLDTDSDCRHHLALARRDNGDIARALEYFRHDISITDVLAGTVPKHLATNGAFWGNIGRCLQLQGTLNEATVCVVRSAMTLNDSDHEIVNRGFAAKWLGEIAEAQNDFNGAYLCFSAAREYWVRSSPPRSREMCDRIASLPVTRADNSAFRIERAYSERLETLSRKGA